MIYIFLNILKIKNILMKFINNIEIIIYLVYKEFRKNEDYKLFILKKIDLFIIYKN